MKTLIILTLLLSYEYSFALGDTSNLPNATRNMKDTTTTLNQVTKDREVVPTPPQDLQERMYQEQQEREEEEWEEQKRHSDYTSDEESSYE